MLHYWAFTTYGVTFVPKVKIVNSSPGWGILNFIWKIPNLSRKMLNFNLEMISTLCINKNTPKSWLSCECKITGNWDNWFYFLFPSKTWVHAQKLLVWKCNYKSTLYWIYYLSKLSLYPPLWRILAQKCWAFIHYQRSLCCEIILNKGRFKSRRHQKSQTNMWMENWGCMNSGWTSAEN